MIENERYPVAEYVMLDAFSTAMRRGDDPQRAVERFNEQAISALHGRAGGGDVDAHPGEHPKARARRIARELARAERREDMLEHQERQRRQGRDQGAQR